MEQPLLIIETDNTDDLPLRFRMASTPHSGETAGMPDLAGYHELNISGSGQFSEKGLRRMRQLIGEGPAMIVDLRQECHGFVNGMAVCWFGTHNNANKGLSREQVEEQEAQRLRGLREAAEVAFDYLEGKSAEVHLPGPISSPVTVLSEKELAKQEGFLYTRFFVTDHHRPGDDEVDRFITFVNSQTNEIWLHFHCRGGVGRTTTFMLMYDMMRNAKRVGLSDILERHRLSGGRDMYRMDPQRDGYKYAPAVERLAFLQQFYQYCADDQDGFETSWSEWLKRQNS